MNRFLHTLATVFISLFLVKNTGFAQISKGGDPLSILAKMDLPTANNLPELDWQRIREEDQKGLGNFRFAAPIEVQFSPQNSGIWSDLPSGEKVWRLRLRSTNALGLALSLEDFELPKGAKLFFYNTDNSIKLGAYDAENNNAARQFFIGFTKGEEAILEYILPQNALNQTPFVIKRVFHAYQQGGLLGTGFGMSLPCHVNINCPEGANWQTQKRGVVRIRVVVTQGVGWCSGALMNNTRQDATPYILSAYHCADGYTPLYAQWTFFFNYESLNCDNPAAEPTLQSLQGCVERSGARETDFQLFELNQRIPSSFLPYFNGWNRDSLTLPTRITLIHHPKGDIKKITADNDPSVIETEPIVWSNSVTSPSQTHLKIVPDIGTTETGSSGSPYFDQNGRIVAQHHGGAITDVCRPTWLAGGWLAKSWNGNGTAATRLKDWLDPLSTNPLNLNGTAAPTPAARVSGNLTTWWGAPLPDQKIYIGSDSATTDALGTFSVPSVRLDVPISVRFSRNINPINGVDALDLLQIRRHLLGVRLLSSNVKLFAADLDDNGEVNALDMLIMRRLLLGISQTIAVGSWRFVPAATINDPDFPANIQIPSVYQITFNGVVSNFNFVAVKMGDVDGNADTSQ